MIVVDTNIIAYLYIEGERTSQAEKLLSTDSDWRAPIVWRSEFRSVLSLYMRKGILSLADALEITQQAEILLDDNEYEVATLPIMRLVDSSNCPAYDCEFVALAENLKIPLITPDRKILQAFPNIARSIEAAVH